MKSTKLDSGKSRFAPKNAEQKRSFEETADKAYDQMTDNNQKAMFLGSSFINLMRDPTLEKNKTIKSLENERNILKEFISFAEQLDNDENNPDCCSGTRSVILALLKICLEFRNKLNENNYKLEELEQELKKINESRGKQ